MYGMSEQDASTTKLFLIHLSGQTFVVARDWTVTESQVLLSVGADARWCKSIPYDFLATRTRATASTYTIVLCHT